MKKRQKRNQWEGWLEQHPYTVSIIAIIFSLVVFSIAIIFRGELVNLGKFGYLGIFVISFFGSASVLLPLPGLFGSFVAGGIYSPILVGIVGAFGATLGELTGYFAGVGGHAIIREKKRYIQIEAQLHKYGLFGLFLFASVPNPFFDLAGIAAGAIRLPISKFFLAAFLGQIVKYMVVAHLGSGIFESLFTPVPTL